MPYNIRQDDVGNKSGACSVAQKSGVESIVEANEATTSVES